MTGDPSHIEIGAPDVGRARRFWGELLGWEFEDTGHGAAARAGSAAAGIHPEDAPSLQAFFEVDDLDAAASRIVELGGEVDEGSSESTAGRYLHSCRDDQGVPFGLYEPSRS